jgi:hypothetical protein
VHGHSRFLWSARGRVPSTPVKRSFSIWIAESFFVDPHTKTIIQEKVLLLT